MERAEAVALAEVELVSAEMELGVWVDAVRWGRRNTAMSSTEVALNAIKLMIRKGLVPQDGPTAGIVAAALIQLADAKDAAGAPLEDG